MKNKKIQELRKLIFGKKNPFKKEYSKKEAEDIKLFLDNFDLKELERK